MCWYEYKKIILKSTKTVQLERLYSTISVYTGRGVSVAMCLLAWLPDYS